jgi:hypothetical protein
MTWPIVEGVSLMHLHVNRGKRSVVIDLRTEEGIGLLLDLVGTADVVVGVGALARQFLEGARSAGLLASRLHHFDDSAARPRPWGRRRRCGLDHSETDANGHPGILDHVSTGINAGLLFGCA